MRNSAGEPSCGAAFHFLRVLEACVQATCMLPSHSEIPLIDGYKKNFPPEKRFVEISDSFEAVVAVALSDEVCGSINCKYVAVVTSMHLNKLVNGAFSCDSS